MKTIELVNGKGFAIVDDDDYMELSGYKWSAQGEGYAQRTDYSKGKYSKALMHRHIMGFPNNMQIDHINGNKLDNRKSNLRLATNMENNRNRSKQGNNKSGYKGVSWHKRDNKWQVHIAINGKNKHLGLFTDQIEAAIAYNKAAVKYHGEFASLNPIPADLQIAS